MATDPNTLDLAGPWLVRADPEDAGAAAGWHEPEKWAMERRTITLPNPMQTALGPDHRGVAWVARKVELPHTWRKSPHERLWIHFESVATDATVWVNGVQIGRHVGDFIPFQFEVTAAAAKGDMWVVIRVDQMHAPRPGPGVLTENGHLTKGFHDVLSLQHSGVWCGVSLRRTGAMALVPNGVSLNADADQMVVRVQIEPGADGDVEVRIHDFDHRRVFSATGRIDLASAEHAITARLPLMDRWSPESPALSTLSVTLADANGHSDSYTSTFGIRTITTGGADNRHILLNGKPLLIRGILHWGHEPDHISPAPTPDQVRAEFTKLKALGFNCVCLCMWYPPEYYFNIADEVGMLIWQEHPVWKSPMHEEHIPEYQRLFTQFFKRDARHPSVFLVSGSCEHERFNPRLAEWWWNTAREMLPNTLKQLQTGFIAWTDPEKTDLHDEHVYDSSGRWVRFVEDVKATTAELPRKPFIMGETIIGTAWVDTSHGEGRGEWWYPKGVDVCRAFEEKLTAKYGTTARDRFVAGAHQQNLAIRKFQAETLRCFDGCAGFVMNQIRDVPVARLGFMDDFGRWRFSSDDTTTWLGDQTLLLRTPGHRRGFAMGTSINAEIGISNFGNPFRGEIQVTHESGIPNARPVTRSIPIECDPGDAHFAPLPLDALQSDWPVRTSIDATAAGIGTNSWKIWRFPAPAALAPAISRLNALPFTAAESEPDFEDRGYSSGWGLKVRSWTPLLQTASRLIPSAAAWKPDAPIAADSFIITHRLTSELINFMTQGGRILLLANKARSGLSARFINVWGQCPLILEGGGGPLSAGDADWIADLLHIDLFDRHPRAIASDDLGIADQVQPLIRLVFTHDRGTPKMFDAAFWTRVGSGLLIATSLDHTGPAGLHLLHQFLNWGATTSLPSGPSLDPALLRKNVL